MLEIFCRKLPFGKFKIPEKFYFLGEKEKFLFYISVVSISLKAKFNLSNSLAENIEKSFIEVILVHF